MKKRHLNRALGFYYGQITLVSLVFSKILGPELELDVCTNVVFFVSEYHDFLICLDARNILTVHVQNTRQ